MLINGEVMYTVYLPTCIPAVSVSGSPERWVLGSAWSPRSCAKCSLATCSWPVGCSSTCYSCAPCPCGGSTSRWPAASTAGWATASAAVSRRTSVTLETLKNGLFVFIATENTDTQFHSWAGTGVVHQNASWEFFLAIIAGLKRVVREGRLSSGGKALVL